MQLTAKRLLAEFRGRKQLVQVYPGGDAHGFEQADQVFGADVAGEAAAVLHLRGMAADTAERGIEMPRAGLESRDVVDEARAARVVEVSDGNEGLSILQFLENGNVQFSHNLQFTNTVNYAVFHRCAMWSSYSR